MKLSRVAISVMLLSVLVACASVKPVIKTVLDDAQVVCVYAQPLEALVPAILTVCNIVNDLEPMVSSIHKARNAEAARSKSCPK